MAANIRIPEIRRIFLQILVGPPWGCSADLA